MKLTRLARKAKLKAEQDKIVKLQAFNSSHFRGKSHLKMQACKILAKMFRPVYRYFKNIANSNLISAWKSQ